MNKSKCIKKHHLERSKSTTATYIILNVYLCRCPYEILTSKIGVICDSLELGLDILLIYKFARQRECSTPLRLKLLKYLSQKGLRLKESL